MLVGHDHLRCFNGASQYMVTYVTMVTWVIVREWFFVNVDFFTISMHNPYERHADACRYIWARGLCTKIGLSWTNQFSYPERITDAKVWIWHAINDTDRIYQITYFRNRFFGYMHVDVGRKSFVRLATMLQTAEQCTPSNCVTASILPSGEYTPGTHDVMITSLLRQNDVILTKWRHFDVITTSLLRNVSTGYLQNSNRHAIVLDM